jgi:DNA polymerase III delta prime subunit
MGSSMNFKTSLILITVSSFTIFSYGSDKIEINPGILETGIIETNTAIVKEVGNKIVYNTKGIAELDKNILKNMCSLDALSDLGISEGKAEEIRNKLTALNLKQLDYYEKINKIGKKQLELLMDDDLHEKDMYKLVDQIGALKTKIAKLRIDQIILLKKNFTLEQIKQLK